MAYDRDERRFVLVANRFRWEGGGDGRRPRSSAPSAGLRIDDVDGVV